MSDLTASLSWAGYEWIRYGRPSLVGIVTGMVAGLATITPASGFVGPLGALVLGGLAGLLCQFAVGWVKTLMKIDDSLDVFAVHGVGGILGTLSTAFLAHEALGGGGLAEGTTMLSQFGVQLLGVVAVVAWTGAATFAIIKVLKPITGLRVDAETEIEGLDINTHGERGYYEIG